MLFISLGPYVVYFVRVLPQQLLKHNTLCCLIMGIFPGFLGNIYLVTFTQLFFELNIERCLKKDIRTLKLILNIFGLIFFLNI